MYSQEGEGVNILFIVNRIEINDAELQSLEDSATAAVIDSWLES